MDNEVNIIETSEYYSTTGTVVSVILVGTLSAFLRNLLYLLASNLIQGRLVRYAIDFLLIVVTYVFALTIFSQLLVQTHIVLLCCILVCIVLLVLRYICYFSSNVGDLLSSPFPDYIPFLTQLRSGLNVITCIAILAVDFSTAFPPTFRKSPSYGTGLMDTGVGLFVFAQGVVSRYARKEMPRVESWREYLREMLIDMKSSFILFILGIARIAILYLSGASQDAKEYGVHWNFFLSLGCVKLLCGVLLPLLPHRISISTLIAGCLFCWVYEYWLVHLGFRQYILHAERGGDFLSNNREGVFSCLGLSGLYLYAVSLGAWIFSERKSVAEWCVFWLLLLALNVLVWLLCLYSMNYVEPVSRRMANASYVLWTLSIALFFLLLLLAFDIITYVFAYLDQVRKFHLSILAQDFAKTDITYIINNNNDNKNNNNNNNNDNNNISNNNNNNNTNNNDNNNSNDNNNDGDDNKNSKYLIENSSATDNKELFLSRITQYIGNYQLVYFVLANIIAWLTNHIIQPKMGTIPSNLAILYLIVCQLVLVYIIRILYRKTARYNLLHNS